MAENVEAPIKENVPQILTGTVVARYIVGIVDGSDENDEPDLIPARGKFEFTPSVGYVPVPLANTPFTLLKDVITGILDDEGYLCTPDPANPTKAGKRGVKLFATDSPNATVKNWTWKVTPRFEGASTRNPANTIPPFEIAVPTGGIVDLTMVEDTPASFPVGVQQALALTASAEEAAQEAKRHAIQAAASAVSAINEAAEAKTIAVSVSDQASRGEFMGDQGPVGPAGPQGPKGATGNTGPQGAASTVAGPQGPKGDTGATGPVGAASTVAGPAGPRGLVGETGPQGPKGATGDKGDAGLRGEDGTSVQIKGSVATKSNLPTSSLEGEGYIVNADGHLYVWGGSAWSDAGEIKGPKGDKGDTGATGLIGPASTVAGPQGPQGLTGPTGPKGDTGAASTVAGPQGPAGAQGPKGDTGDTGATGAASTVAGPQGPIGATGAKGATGATGATGPQGPIGLTGAASTVAGPKGDTGATGPQGPKGDTGATGAASTVAGPQGPAGPTGATGSQGPKGDTGATGAASTVAGPQGPAGTAATVTVSGTTTGAAGTAAAVTSGGTASARTLAFAIPKGDTGATGPQGPQGPIGATGPQGPEADPTVTFRGPLSVWGDALKRNNVLKGTPAPAIWVSLGSSTAEGNSATIISEYSWFARVAKYLTKNVSFDILAAASRPATGIHAYNGALGGTMASNYLPSTKLAKITLLKPTLVTHLVGSNDYANGIAVATYKNQIRTAVQQVNTASPGCVQVLVHQQSRIDMQDPVSPWESYGQALKEVAAEFSNVVFFNVDEKFRHLGLYPSTDRAGLMADLLHMGDTGHQLLAEYMAEFLGTPIKYGRTEIINHGMFDNVSGIGLTGVYATIPVKPKPYPRIAKLEASLYGYSVNNEITEVGLEGYLGGDTSTVRLANSFPAYLRLHGPGAAVGANYSSFGLFLIPANEQATLKVHKTAAQQYLSAHNAYSRVAATITPA